MKKLKPSSVFVSLLFLVATFVGNSWALGRCEVITAPLCTNLGYNFTLMPNFMGHQTQKEAIIGLLPYEPLLRLKCSPYIRQFICSIFVPLCSEHVSVPIHACKGLCEQVEQDCHQALSSMGFAWPQELNCSRFREPPELCMQQPASDENEIVQGNYINPEDVVYNLSKCPPHTKLTGNKCVPLCQYGGQIKKEDSEKFEIWVAVWSIISLVFTTFGLLTFLIQPKRFRWPARPILYLTSCGFISSTIYLIRWVEGPYTCTGDSALEKPSESLSCVGISLILLFCDIAYSLWWCVFAFVWFLSAMKEWSTEAIEKISTRLHASVWILSAFPMVYILVSNNININYISGFCEVKNVPLLMFQLVFIIISSILCMLTSVALKNVRKTLILVGRSPLKLERLFYRLLIISIGICVPHFLYLVCQFYDNFSNALLKLVLKKVSIIFATLWVFSPKTFQVWKQILMSPFHHFSSTNNTTTSGSNKDIIQSKETKTNNKSILKSIFSFRNFFKKKNNEVNKSNLPLMPITKV